jgi:hypothetical protein
MKWEGHCIAGTAGKIEALEWLVGFCLMIVMPILNILGIETLTLLPPDFWCLWYCMIVKALPRWAGV